MVGRWQLCLLLAAAGLWGCAYDPPVQGDRNSPAFQRALKGCRTGAERAQGQREGTPGAAIAAVFDFKEAEHRDVQSCMQGRGYAPR